MYSLIGPTSLSGSIGSISALRSCWLMTHQTEMNFGLVQRSAMGKRLDFCLTICLYITFFSALFNAVQLMDDDNLLVSTVDGTETVLDVGSA